MPSPYSAAFLVAVQRTVTVERLTRYLNAAGADFSKALELYELNVQLSAILYGMLQGLEVAVRNAEHQALTRSFGAPDWYDVPPSPGFGMPAAGSMGPAWHEYAVLSPYWRDKVDEAKLKPGVGNNPGKVIAELTFGFWVDLVKSVNHRRLWVDRKLHAAFPNARGVQRSVIHDRLKAIQLLRNRISHHEPVITSSNRLYNGVDFLTLDEILDSVRWVCNHTADWLKTDFGSSEADRILKLVAGMRITL
jgi:hypothetical protein